MTSHTWRTVRTYLVTFAALTTLATLAAPAQKASLPPARVDVAVTYTADRTNPLGGTDQWLMGGSVELGARAVRDLSVVVRVTGVTTDSLGSQDVPLSLVMTTFGPRYTFHVSRFAAHGEALIGEANGVHGLFVAPGQNFPPSFAFALQVGGGLDYRFSRHFGARVVDANWTRTQFNNTATNVQNHLLLGAGPVLTF